MYEIEHAVNIGEYVIQSESNFARLKAALFTDHYAISANFTINTKPTITSKNFDWKKLDKAFPHKM